MCSVRLCRIPIHPISSRDISVLLSVLLSSQSLIMLLKHFGFYIHKQLVPDFLKCFIKIFYVEV